MTQNLTDVSGVADRVGVLLVLLLLAAGLVALLERTHRRTAAERVIRPGADRTADRDAARLDDDLRAARHDSHRDSHGDSHHEDPLAADVVTSPSSGRRTAAHPKRLRAV